MPSRLNTCISKLSICRKGKSCYEGENRDWLQFAAEDFTDESGRCILGAHAFLLV